MKKKLLFASLIALTMAGCSDNDFESNPGRDAIKGIAFGTNVDPAAVAPTTRGEYTYDGTSYEWKWYAERDRAKIWSSNIALNGAVKTKLWTSVANTDGAIYKATSSQGRGLFTAQDDTNMLTFVDNKTTDFLIVYPSTISLASATVIGGTGTDKENLATATFTTLPALAGQQMNDLANDPSTRLIRYQYTNAKQEAGYESVGDKVELSLLNVNTMAQFNIKNLRDYSNAAANSVFGNLTSIALTMAGALKTDGTPLDNAAANNVTPTIIDYGTAATLAVDFTDRTKNAVTTAAGTASTISVAVGQPWSDGEYAFMAINNVNRKAFKDLGVKETVYVTYTFANITLKDTLTTNGNWPTNPGQFVPVPTLDINKFPYLVAGTGADRTLIVNKGTLAQVFNADKTQVIWNSEPTTGLVPVVNFTKVIIAPDLAAADLALVTKFANTADLALIGQVSVPAELFNTTPAFAKLQTVTLESATTIGKNAFKGAYDGAAAITSIIAPNAKTIDDTAFDNVNLNVVKLAAYKFDNDAKDDLLKATHLVSLDMSAVTVMGNVFPEAGFTLMNYGLLKDVTLGNVQLGSSSFLGCSALQIIKGGSVTLRGSSVFEGCTALANVCNPTYDAAKPTVNTGKFYVKTNENNGNILASEFKGCVELVGLYDATTNALLKPVSIASSAFEGCTKLVNVPLKDAKTINAKAFLDCVSLEGKDTYTDPITKVTKTNVLWVVAENISASAFENCDKLVYVYFEKATTIENNILNSSNTARTLKEVKFELPMKSSTTTTASSTTFGSTANAAKVILYVASGQQDVDGKTLTLVSGQPIIFSSIEQ